MMSPASFIFQRQRHGLRAARLPLRRAQLPGGIEFRRIKRRPGGGVVARHAIAGQGRQRRAALLAARRAPRPATGLPRPGVPSPAARPPVVPAPRRSRDWSPNCSTCASPLRINASACA